VKANARGWARWTLAGCALALAGACGEDPRPPAMDLFVRAEWNDTPASADQIGYQVEAEIVMLDRNQSCVPLPDLRITINDADYPIVAGDCDTHVSATARPVRTDAATVVTLRSSYGLMGAATFPGLFPGSGASQLVSPADGRVRMGEKVAVTIPAGWPVGDGRVSAFLYWLDPAPSVPPFASYVLANATVDRTAVEVTAPMLTGRAQVILQSLESPENVNADACTGFERCIGYDTADVLGPVAIEVIP
jgi:hypothetical protein